MKSIKLLMIGMLLLLGVSCSVSPKPVEPEFLDKVKGKTIYSDEAKTKSLATFSADGKVANSVQKRTFTLKQVVDKNNAIYTITLTIISFNIPITFTSSSSGIIKASSIPGQKDLLFYI